MSNEPIDYAVKILKVSLWEWTGIEDRCLKDIARSGPNEHSVPTLEEAQRNIKELSAAIKILTP